MEDAPGALYIVATPIGNLEDITLRALRVLKEADIVAAEDTRHTHKLLTHFGIHAHLTSYHDHNKAYKAPVLIERMKGGATVALVTDAGTPLISDPGYLLVTEARREGLSVVPVPGPTAVAALLSVGGLPTDAYTFLGYLSNRSAARRRKLEEFRDHPYTLVLFESPHRLLKCLADILEVLGDRQVTVGRELTKQHEEVVSGPVSEMLARFSGGKVLGEFTLLVEGRSRRARQAARRAEKASRSGRGQRP